MRGEANRQTLGSRRERVVADVCVIGAGIAGLIAGTRIAARSGLHVVVIESGAAPVDHDERVGLLDTIINPGGNYRGDARSRGVGGTSARWAGKLLPLSPGDMAARPYLDLPAWPIEHRALSRFTPEIERMMGVAEDAYEHGADANVDPWRRLPLDPAGIVWRWPKRPSKANHRIDHVLRRDIDRLPNLTLWTDATVTRLIAAEGRLTTVIAINHRGGELRLDAGSFIVAAGTMETTRLLLLADAQNEGCISRETDTLGRYFNDHFAVEVAQLRSPVPEVVNRALADRRVHGTLRHLHGELSKGRQESARAGSAYFDFACDFPASSPTRQLGAGLASLRDRDARGFVEHVGRALTDPASLARSIAWRLVDGQQFWPSGVAVSAKLWIEQLPARDNRLRLADKRDTLGQAMLRVDLTKSDADERTFKAGVESLRRFWAMSMDASTLDWASFPGRSVDAAGEQAHPAGSTRMGHDARQSVVDPRLRVHMLDNVQVASASVFPSSGSANPTLTIMQLAMLAADDLLARHARSTARLNRGDLPRRISVEVKLDKEESSAPQQVGRAQS